VFNFIHFCRADFAKGNKVAQQSHTKRIGQYLFATFGIDGHALKFCGQNLTQFQSVIQLQENGHLVCSVRRRDKRQPSLEQQEQSDEH